MMYNISHTDQPLVNSYFIQYPRPGKLGYALISFLVIAPIVLGLGVCYNFARHEQESLNNEEDGEPLTKMLIWFKLLNMSNIKFNVYAVILSFGIVFPQLTITALQAIILEVACTGNKDLIANNNKPKLVNFYEISIVPIGILLYATLFEIVLDNSSASLVILLISATYMLIMKVALVFPSLAMILVTFPFRFWTVTLYTRTLVD